MKTVITLVLILLALGAFILWMRFQTAPKDESWEEDRTADCFIAEISDPKEDLCRSRNYTFHPSNQ